MQTTGASYTSRQRGISLVLVLFILVVLGLLAAVMVKLSAISGDAVAREVVSTRALLAAESGAQWQMNRVFGGVGCSDASPTFPVFGDCEAVVTRCEAISVGADFYYLISSEASCGPADEQAVRKIELQARTL